MQACLALNKGFKYVYLLAPEIQHPPHRSTVSTSEPLVEGDIPNTGDEESGLACLGERHEHVPIAAPTSPVPRHPCNDLSPFEHVAFQALTIVSKACRGLVHFSITLGDVHYADGVIPNVQTVHLLVDKDDSMRSKFVDEKNIGWDMKVFGNMSKCMYEDMVEKVSELFTRPHS
jgi:hypothetical protein